MAGWSFADVWDRIAAEVPDRTAVVCGEQRRTYGEFRQRAAGLAGFLAEHGVAAGSKVAIDLVNRPEYLEVFFAALRLGAVPVNVNFRYGVEETRYLLADSDAVAVVTEARFAATVHAAVDLLQGPAPLVVELGPGYDAAVAHEPPGATRPPDGDDLIFLYTGGTTGMPKGVMWRNDDLYVALWQMGRPGTAPPDPLAAVRVRQAVGHGPPRLPAHARHRAVHHTLDPLRRAAPSC